VRAIHVAPGNAGTAHMTDHVRNVSIANVAIRSDDSAGLLAHAREQHIDLTVVGPEAPLAAGVVDAFQHTGLRIFGPTQAAAQLEASKVFAKSFMREHRIPTAQAASFTDYEAAREWLRESDRPVVVKADGLAAGKGVIMCDNRAEAEAALQRVLQAREFGAAGDAVLIEERLSGPEVSVLAFCDGQHVLPLPPARDHKRVGDGDQGPNTGGMGAYAPTPDVDAALIEQIRRTVLQPTVDGMAARGTPYSGVLYAGIMLTATGPKVLEFNCRFGDPETQALLPLLNSDLADIMLACTAGRLDEIAPHVRWHTGACATVVLAAPGYPGRYPTGTAISGLEQAQQRPQVTVFHAGTAERDGQAVTAGGRVLAVSARDVNLPAALARAYGAISDIHFDGMHYRRDIGRQTP
jgi:phosphoribosylamine--glycine ligase